MRILQEQSAIMGRVFLDFVIVGDGLYWSMFEELDGGEYTLGAAA